ncbi:hypothetical protein BDV95DRAFT_591267 [Massariosphaeria phaeospora]|uniref:Uncharacterized protein n=1 Tax=Massariosphaeria phaeospora TaxID=100035 RepID=A0A7C8MDL3_9PLEO|nr:hypothetical protein BDV95DRAFT_591267 [Massariosphaeria phaeospora]
MSQNPPNPQGPDQGKQLSFEDGSLLPFLRAYVRVRNRPNYNFGPDVERVQRMLDQLDNFEAHPNLVHDFVAAVSNNPAGQHAFSDVFNDTTLMIMILLRDNRRHGGLWLPPRQPANEAYNQATTTGQAPVYPNWQNPAGFQPRTVVQAPPGFGTPAAPPRPAFASPPRASGNIGRSPSRPQPGITPSAFGNTTGGYVPSGSPPRGLGSPRGNFGAIGTFPSNWRGKSSGGQGRGRGASGSHDTEG